MQHPSSLRCHGAGADGSGPAGCLQSKGARTCVVAGITRQDGKEQVLSQHPAHMASSRRGLSRLTPAKQCRVVVTVVVGVIAQVTLRLEDQVIISTRASGGESALIVLRCAVALTQHVV